MTEKVEKAQSYYLYYGEERINVTREVMHEVRQHINHVRRIALNERRCGQRDYHSCCGDCGVCRWNREGLLISKDKLMEENDFQIASPFDMEEVILSSMTMTHVYRFAEETAKGGAMMLRLRLEDSLSIREIANEMHIQKTTVERSLRRILREIRANAKKLF